MSTETLDLRVTRLETALAAFSEELRLAFRYIQPDAASSLTKSRTILEKLVLQLYVAEMGKEPRKPLLGDMLGDNQFTRRIDRRILSRMNSIRDLGNLGPHGEHVDASDAARVLDDLCEVLDWYLQRPSRPAPQDSAGRSSAPPPARAQAAARSRAAKSDVNHHGARFPRWLAVGVSALLLAAAVGYWWRTRANSAAARGGADPPAPVGAAMKPASAPGEKRLTGTVDVLLWNKADPNRRGLRLNAPGALPVQTGDQIRVAVRMSRPAYVYLVWIDSEGNASPVYPWTPGHWDRLPEKQAPVEHLSLPEEADEGWPMRGAAGMETLVLLSRSTPLADLDLRPLLSGLPPQKMQTSQSVVWFADGRVVDKATDLDRGPDFFNPQELDDPVLQTQRLLHDRLASKFEAIRAVSFAHRAD